MNKKQVGALLKVIAKDDFRPALKLANIGELNGLPTLFATNGYIAAAITLEEEARELIGKNIRREAIEKWHKLATGKSRLTGEELVDVSNEDFAASGGYSELTYPDWKKIVEMQQGEPNGKIAFDGEFAKIIQDLSGEKFLEWEFGAPLDQVRARTSMGLFIIMPVRV